MDAQTILPVPIEKEMKDSYMSYAMSVIVGRALPDVRDGLKPVHRRILYGMKEMGLTHDKPYKKSARIVGDVMGKYHPHGDMAVYDAIVRMVQDFSLRYPLIDGQGNFGSVDGDSAAAMRYTEVRMARLAEELLVDIEKDTVQFAPNFDDTLKEPVVLPSKVPNLLINGSSGIAVGMATNMAPHNLSEVVDGVIAVIDDPDIELKDLMYHVQGPDFPTGGFIHGRSGIHESYATGRGRLKIRANAEIEEHGGRERIVITEIPYQVNKSKLIEDIAGLVKDKRIEGISDLRDESDREGLRIVVELSRGVQAQVVLNKLFKHTQMETTFGVINLALVDGEPRVMGLMELIHHFIEHRREVVVKRTEFDLGKAESRAHILEGLQIALDHIDEVIKLIRASRTVEEARNGLMEKFSLSEEQARAILDMRLQKLTGLEREKVDEELREVRALIDHLRKVLASNQMVLDIIKEELMEIRAKYADERRTQIIEDDGEMDIEDLIPNEKVVVTITNTGYIKRILVDAYRQQRRGGKGVRGMETKDEDFVRDIFIADTHDYLIFFTNKGRAYWLRVYKIPEGTRYSRGKAIVNLLQLTDGERITASLPLVDLTSDCFIFMATRRGTVKKTVCSAFSRPRSAGIIALNLVEGDELIGVLKTTGKDDILLGTRFGQVIRFHETDVRDMGRTATGVRGIRLETNDEVVGVEKAREDASLLCLTENGFGKRSAVSQFPVRHRGGKGVIGIIPSLRNGMVVGMRCVNVDDELIVTSQSGIIIRIPVEGIREMGRNTQGVKIMNVAQGDRMVAVARMIPEEEE